MLGSIFFPLLLGGAGDGTFLAPTRIDTATSPVEGAAGDFDGDGRSDLALADGSSRVLVLLDDPARWRAWQAALKVSAGNSIVAVLSSDLDRDGMDDIIAVDPGSAAWTIRSLGGGFFERPVSLPAAAGARAAAAADLDGDGWIDLVFALYMSGSVSIFSGGDGGPVHVASPNAGPEPHDLVLVDTDGDGAMDLALARGQDRPVLILRAKGNWTYETSEVAGSRGHAVRSADLNGDGRPDLVTEDCILANDGTGAFRPMACRGDFNDNPLFCLGDLDGDGATDMGRINATGSLSVGLGLGDFTFTAFPLTLNAAYGSFIDILDLDGDGRRDLLAGRQDGSLNVFWGTARQMLLECPQAMTGGQAAVADLDGSGVPDVFLLVNKTTVFLDPGRTPPGPWSGLSLALAQWPKLLWAAADMDADAVPDLLALYGQDLGAFVAFLDAGGTVSAEVALSCCANVTALPALGPLEGGPSPDLAIPDPVGSRIIIERNLGERRFSAPMDLPSIAFCRTIALGDVDLDGLLDIVAGGSQVVAVHLAKGDSRFGDAETIETGGSSVGVVGLGDLDGDGAPDVIDSRASGTTAVFRGNGDGSFTAGRPISLGRISSLRLVDLDGRGGLDLVAGASEKVIVVLGDGGGWFGSKTVYLVPSAADRVHVADFDGDGALDVFASDNSRSAFLFGRGPSDLPRFLRGDATADGALDLTDAMAVLARLFLGGAALPCEDGADSNDDGALDLADPIALLRSLFLGEGPLPPPGPAECGPDPTPDALASCARGC